MRLKCKLSVPEIVSYKNKYKLYKINVLNTLHLQKMNKFTDNKNYDTSTSVMSVVIGPYIVYVYMYPIC